MDLYKVINDISQITLALDKSIKVILKSLDDQYQSLSKQIQDIENQNQNPLIQLTDTSADLNNSTLCQTPKNSARTYSKPAQSKPLVSDESKQLEQKKENLRKEQNMFIQQQEKYKEEYLQKLRNEQAKHQQIFSQLSKESLQFRVLKQKIINYKNSMSLQQLEKESKLEQKLLYFVDEDLHQIQKISFNYIDVLNLQHQVLQVCQGNIQLYKNTENQIQQYYNYIQVENQRQEQERQKEQQKRQEEMQKEKLKQEQMEIERLKQLELEQQKQQRLKEDVIKQQLEKQKQVEEELTKSQLIQDVNDESDNLSDTQEITSECKNCGQAIRENNIQLNCFHSYHLLCLIQRIMSHQTSCIKCFCNEVIPFKIIKEVLSTSPQNAKYYEEFLKSTIQTILTNSQHPYTSCQKCGFVYLSPENTKVDQCSECSII